jgi:hypothetical protein
MSKSQKRSRGTSSEQNRHIVFPSSGEPVRGVLGAVGAVLALQQAGVTPSKLRGVSAGSLSAADLLPSRNK